MSRVIEKTNGLTRVLHQQSNFCVCFDDGSHMVVKGHPNPEIRHAFSKLRKFASVSRPFFCF